MKNKKRLISYLLFGSLLFACLFTFGCKTEVLAQYISTTYWEYNNQSSYDITINEFGERLESYCFIIKKGEMQKKRIVYGREEGTVKLDFFRSNMPLCQDDTFQDSVLVVDKKVYSIADSTYFRNLDNYEIVTEDSIGYTFTYTFTDSIISEIIGK